MTGAFQSIFPIECYVTVNNDLLKLSESALEIYIAIARLVADHSCAIIFRVHLLRV